MAKRRRFALEGRRRAYIVSYPKCGRTWLRVMLGRVLATRYGIQDLPSHRKLLKLHKLAKLHPELPVVRVTHDDYPHWRRPDELSTDKSRYRPWPTIFLARDPRDVMVSAYFEQSRRVGGYVERLRRKAALADVRDRLRPYEGSLSDFVREDAGGLNSYLAFLEVWRAALPTLPEAIVIRYEDLREDPARELRRALEALAVDGVGETAIADAVSFATFESLAEKERAGVFRTHKLMPRDPNDPESFKVRRGVVGGYVDYLEPADIAWIEERMRERLDPDWGYRPARPIRADPD